MSAFSIRSARPDDEAAAYYVCLKTGDHGADGAKDDNESGRLEQGVGVIIDQYRMGQESQHRDQRH